MYVGTQENNNILAPHFCRTLVCQSVRVSVKAEFQGILGRLVSLMHGRKLFELETSTRID